MLKKVTLTYHAPPGDAKVIEAYGKNLLDGESKECLVPEEELAKLRNNRYFEVGDEQDADPKPDKQADEAAQKAAEAKDAAKREAQLPNPPMRGAVLNKEEYPPAEDEGEGEEEGGAAKAPKSATEGRPQASGQASGQAHGQATGHQSGKTKADN